MPKVNLFLEKARGQKKVAVFCRQKCITPLANYTLTPPVKIRARKKPFTLRVSIQNTQRSIFVGFAPISSFI